MTERKKTATIYLNSSDHPLFLKNNLHRRRSSSFAPENQIQLIQIPPRLNGNDDHQAVLEKIDESSNNESKLQSNEDTESWTQLINSLFDSTWFNVLYFILLAVFVVASLGYGCAQEEDLRKAFMIIEEICQGLLFIRLVLKVIIQGKQEIVCNILDFITIIFSFIGFNLQNEKVGRYFLAFRALKMIFFIKEVPCLSQEMKIFQNSLRKASSILVPALCLIYVYAIVGLYSFHDLQYNRCRDPANLNKTANWTVYKDEIFLCGKKTCPVVDGIQYQCLNPINYNVQPNPDELWNIEQGYGLMTYNHIGTAFFTTFKQTLLTGSSRIIVLLRQSLDDGYILTYFYTLIYLIAYIYLNIFYGVMLTELEEKQNSLERKNCPKYTITIIKKNIFQVEAQNRRELMPIENLLDQDDLSSKNQSNHQEQPPKQQNKVEFRKCYKFVKIFNAVITVFSCINLSLDFQGQPQNFRFIVDCLDFSYLILIIIILIITIVVEYKQEGEVKKETIIDIIIIGICLVGVMYEASIASSFSSFLSAETIIAKVFRTTKYLRVMIIIFHKSIWEEGHKLVVCIFKAVLELRRIILIWVIVMLILSLMGYHLHTGNTLVNRQGKLDLKNGKPHQISFDTAYHALIFTILSVYDEEWDYLMFQEYVGSGIIVVIWMTLTMIIGFIIFSRYLTCLLSQKLEVLLDKYEEEKNEQQDDDEKSVFDNEECQLIYNKVAPVSINEGDQVTFFHRCERVKRFLMKMLDSKPFKAIKMCFIIMVLYTLYLDLPNKKLTDEQNNVNFILKTLTFIFFLLETIATIAFYGLVRNQYSYMKRSYLSVLNFIILAVQLLYLTPLSQLYTMRRISRVRALRALFAIELRYRCYWDMRIIVRALMVFATKFLQLLLISCIIYFYFALILTKVYQNEGYYCDNAHEQAVIKTKHDCFNWGGDWVRHQINFSHVFSSLLSLTFIGTMQGWVYFMQKMMNFNGSDNAPSYNANEHIQIFFIIFFFLGNMIILNSFISLSLITFKKLKEEKTGEKYINETEKTWLKLKISISGLDNLKKQKPPQNCIRSVFYKICSHKCYTISKAIFFLLYVILISFSQSNLSTFWSNFLKNGLKIFFLIMLIQYLLQLIAFGYRVNRKKEFIYQTFACVYVLAYFVVESVLPSSSFFTDRAFGGLLIFFQVLRYLKLLDKIPFAQKVFKTIFSILPKTINLLFIIVPTLLIYSIIGIQLFCFLKHNTEIDDFNQNYEGFGTALFALIKFSTMESPIEQIKNAAQTLQPNFICHEISNYEEFLQYGQNGCGSPIASYTFFISFHIFYSLFLMSTLIALIVDAYSDIKKEENSQITVDVLEKVVKEWAEYDPEAEGYISYRDFWQFSGKVFKIYSKKDRRSAKRMNLFDFCSDDFLIKLDLKVYKRPQSQRYWFKFHEVIESLTKLYLEKKLDYEIKERKVHRKCVEKEVEEDDDSIKDITIADIHRLLMAKAALKEWKKKLNIIKEDNILENLSEVIIFQ